MFEKKLSHLIKRDGSVKDFDASKIVNAIAKAGKATGEFDIGIAQQLTEERVLPKLRALKLVTPHIEQVQDAVELEVRTDYLGMREAEKRISTTQVAVAQAEEDYHIAVVRYQAGVGTNIDVMDAQVALTEAKTNYVKALYDYNTSKAALNTSMGVGVPVPEPRTFPEPAEDTAVTNEAPADTQAANETPAEAENAAEQPAAIETAPAAQAEAPAAEAPAANAEAAAQ